MARITFVHPPIDMSGGAKVVCTYAHELGKLGHEVTLVTPGYEGQPFSQKLRSFLKGEGWPLDQQLSHMDGKQIRLAAIDSDRPVLETDVPDADFVIATWWETAEWVYRFPPTKGKKFHFIQHHEVTSQFPYLPARSKEVYKLPLRKIVVAAWLKDLMATEYGCSAEVVLNTVDRDVYRSPVRDKQTVPTVGLLYSTTGFKGLDISIAALQLVASKIPNLRVLSFGGERQKAHSLLPKGSRFSFLPPLDVLAGIYRSCDVWLTASRSEGFNLPALEAMASRTPVISTKTGWPAEGIQDGANGYLAEVDDVAGLADAVFRVLSLDNARWKLMSEAAHQTMTTPSWAHSAKLFEKALLGADH
jgi:glycosyltransferase involved in cell wall biosynthesis